jgi:hypothetical protein
VGISEKCQNFPFGNRRGKNVDSGAPSELGNHPTRSARIRTKIYHPTVAFPDEWRKFLPTDLISIHWYDVPSLKRLVFNFIAKGKQGGPDLTLRQFVSQFPGFTDKKRCKAVCDQFPDIDRLSDFEGREERVADLLAAMQSAPGIRRPKPDSMGLIGEDNFFRRFDDWYGIVREGDGKDRFWYSSTSVEVNGTPYVFEVAVAQTKKPGRLFHGANFTPTFDDPLAGISLRHEYKSGRKTCENYGSSTEGFLDKAHVRVAGYRIADCKLPFRSAAAIHLVSPGSQFLDKGKTRLSLPNDVVDAIAEALWEATKVLHQEGGGTTQFFLSRKPDSGPCSRTPSWPRGSTWQSSRAKAMRPRRAGHCSSLPTRENTNSL